MKAMRAPDPGLDPVLMVNMIEESRRMRDNDNNNNINNNNFNNNDNNNSYL